jgi:hypothetical protein
MYLYPEEYYSSYGTVTHQALFSQMLVTNTTAETGFIGGVGEAGLKNFMESLSPTCVVS